MYVFGSWGQQPTQEAFRKRGKGGIKGSDVMVSAHIHAKHHQRFR